MRNKLKDIICVHWGLKKTYKQADFKILKY